MPDQADALKAVEVAISPTAKLSGSDWTKIGTGHVATLGGVLFAIWGWANTMSNNLSQQSLKLDQLNAALVEMKKDQESARTSAATAMQEFKTDVRNDIQRLDRRIDHFDDTFRDRSRSSKDKSD